MGIVKLLFKNNFIKLVSGIALINVILAVVSFFKDIAFAAYMGTSQYSDYLLLAYFVPDTISNNLISYTIGVTSIPVFTKLYSAHETARLKRLVYRLVIWAVVIMSILIMIFYTGRSSIVRILGAGFSNEGIYMTLNLLYIVLPTMLMLPSINIFGAFLQTIGKFNIPSLAPVLFNTVFLAGVLIPMAAGTLPEKGVYTVAFSILAGAASMLILVLVEFLRNSRKVFLKTSTVMIKNQESKDLLQVMRLFVPYFIIIFSSQAVLFVERNIASGLSAGSISGLNYAYRLSQFPLWVFVAAVSMVILPSMSKLSAADSINKLKGVLRKTLFLIAFVLLPLSIIMFFLRVPIITLLFGRGAFGAESIRITAAILAGFSFSIVFQGFSQICLRVFLALEETKKPIIAYAVSSIVNIVLDYYFIKLFGVAGLGIGAAVASFINTVMQLYMLRQCLGKDSLFKQNIYPKLILLNLPLLIVSYLAMKLWPVWPIKGTLSGFSYAIAAFVICLASYFPAIKAYILSKDVI